LLSLRHLPARLNAEEAGWLLGFTKEEITILVAKKILKPLGNPSINGRKSFSAAEILPLEIWSRLRRGMTPEINAISTVLFLFSLAAILLWFHLRTRNQQTEITAPVVSTSNKD
jgi:spermidine/putrescine transport system permease protein